METSGKIQYRPDTCDSSFGVISTQKRIGIFQPNRAVQERNDNRYFFLTDRSPFHGQTTEFIKRLLLFVSSFQLTASSLRFSPRDHGTPTLTRVRGSLDIMVPIVAIFFEDYRVGCFHACSSSTVSSSERDEHHRQGFDIPTWKHQYCGNSRRKGRQCQTRGLSC